MDGRWPDETRLIDWSIRGTVRDSRVTFGRSDAGLYLVSLKWTTVMLEPCELTIRANGYQDVLARACAALTAAGEQL